LISSFECFFLFFLAFRPSSMDLLSTISLPEGTIPLHDFGFLRARHFSPSALRKPFLARLRPLLERNRITSPSQESSVKFRVLVSEEIFSSPSALLPFFSLAGGTADQHQEWAQYVLDALPLDSTLDNVTSGDKGGKDKTEATPESPNVTARSPIRGSGSEVSLSHANLSDVTFKSVGDFSVGDWVTIIVSALARPALLATLRVLHVRAHIDDASTLFSRNAANFLRTSIPLAVVFRAGLPLYKFAVADYHESPF
jgi:hypothetical protein